jgi:hypothetical protein
VDEIRPLTPPRRVAKSPDPSSRRRWAPTTPLRTLRRRRRTHRTTSPAAAPGAAPRPGRGRAEIRPRAARRRPDPNRATRDLRAAPGNAHWGRHSGDGPVRWEARVQDRRQWSRFQKFSEVSITHPGTDLCVTHRSNSGNQVGGGLAP